MRLSLLKAAAFECIHTPRPGPKTTIARHSRYCDNCPVVAAFEASDGSYRLACRLSKNFSK